MYRWKLSMICCCVTPSGGQQAMFLLRWLWRATDGTLGRKGEWGMGDGAGILAAASTPLRWCGGKASREEDAVYHLVELEHKARGHGVEH